MKIYTDLNQLNTEDMTSVALGNFDGLHIGHRKIMGDAVNYAKNNCLKSLCFTFSNHPFNFILHRKDDDPEAIKMICSEDEKEKLIKEMGFDILVNIPFDEKIMTMPADDFFKDIVIAKLNAACVSAGFNYSYGSRASGNADSLIEECKSAGITCNIHEAVKVGDIVVSSTLIREKLSEGHMEAVERYLDRAYSFKGDVQHGKRLGSSNGIPTANLIPDAEKIIPPHGVYFTRTILDGREYKSVSNIGCRPTVQNEELIDIETNLFDFEGDLYGKEIEVIFDHFSRPETKFDSKEELFNQIRQDCQNAKEYYKNR